MVCSCLVCPSVWVPECPSVQVPGVPFECLIALSDQVPEYLECLSGLGVPLEFPWSAQIPLELRWSALWVPLQWPFSVQVPFECSSTKKGSHYYCENGLLHSFIEFFKSFSENMFYITRIVFCFLRNKMCNFSHVLLAKYNHSNNFEKLSLNILFSEVSEN